MKEFAQELGITFDILQDQSGSIQQLYQTTGVPESFLLDRDGTIVKRVIGAHDWASGANRKLIEGISATSLFGGPRHAAIAQDPLENPRHRDIVR